MYTAGVEPGNTFAGSPAFTKGSFLSSLQCGLDSSWGSPERRGGTTDWPVSVPSPNLPLPWPREALQGGDSELLHWVFTWLGGRNMQAVPHHSMPRPSLQPLNPTNLHDGSGPAWPSEEPPHSCRPPTRHTMPAPHTGLSRLYTLSLKLAGAGQATEHSAFPTTP